jgi:hypothetical protein
VGRISIHIGPISLKMPAAPASARGWSPLGEFAATNAAMARYLSRGGTGLHENQRKEVK